MSEAIWALVLLTLFAIGMMELDKGVAKNKLDIQNSQINIGDCVLPIDIGIVGKIIDKTPKGALLIGFKEDVKIVYDSDLRLKKVTCN